MLDINPKEVFQYEKTHQINKKSYPLLALACINSDASSNYILEVKSSK